MILCMAQGTDQPACAWRCAPDRAAPTGLDGQRQGLWLSQINGWPAWCWRDLFWEPCCKLGQSRRHHRADWV